MAQDLKKGKVVSCGCYGEVIRGKAALTHGMSGSRPFLLWQNLKARCKNPNSESYEDYGGRGISYDPKWETFEGFWEDMQEGYSPELSLDRVDVNGGYCKENCRWTTYSVQSFNRRKQKNNTTGREGVYWDKKLGNWRVGIDVNNQRIYLGNFTTFDDAVKAREQAELKYYGVIKQGVTDERYQ